ncbi:MULTISPECIES: class I SAM-dependent methyltransferase [Roseomonadaceae]|uniref:Methyltransferase type 11 domain-containing protein n=1 Tax=Falsiroseomonas oleicola TaxID=2801474 RepID=A0ABS6HII4_9PROT|nr:hypothetical protein [Roseomonas oleicola]MBU8547286.1 hypothetical protein [Roseomonas oleicola]
MESEKRSLLAPPAVEQAGFDWSALDDTASLFSLANLDDRLMTDRVDDTADYTALLGDKATDLRPFLNIGAGDWSHPCWRNHDFVQPPYDQYTPPDYNIDLSVLESWPVESNFLYGAFTSHTIEHLTDEMVMHIFSEMARIIRPGGVFRISTPDFYTAYAAWKINDARYYDQRSTGRLKRDVLMINTNSGFSKGKPVHQLYFERIASCYGALKEWRGLPLEEAIIAEHASRPPEAAADSILANADFSRKKPNQHINYWTEQKLRRMLVSSGFRLVLRSSYGQSILPLMRNKAYFDKTRPNESIWVDAVR